MNQPLLKECYCGRTFRTYPSKVAIGRGKFCSKGCSMKITNRILPMSGLMTRVKKGSKPWSYKGFRLTRARANGKPYKQLFMPGHPDSDSSGYIREHRYVMAKHLSRRLLSCEIVHHIDGNTLNNDVSNLQVMNKREHDRMNTTLNIHRRWTQGKTPVRN